ncbi:cytochrome P450 [Rhodopirellula sp. SWK7]|uniref:cytochrome P450 n=1 Tax=Rhodopirellula sp. SWK7 TaxID=595460 RepID=UPI0002BEBAD7|nr:cytochrome P450 [Rhodopirellula sp. SWK7]EMI40751.1 cytochrome P450 [Rhodopirellula sp. SWK7]
MGSQLPAGPKSILRSTWGVIRNPKGYFEKAVANYGDPFLMTAMNGPVVVTGKPESVEQIFRAPPDTLGVFARDSLLPLLGAGSLLLMEGTKHRAERKRIAPPLHGSCMKTYGNTMQETARNAITQYESGASFTGLQIGTDISLDVILKAILGADTERLLADFRESTRKVLARSWPILFFSPKTQFPFLGLSPIDRLRSAQQHLREQLRTELERRGREINERDDLLSILARSTDESPAPDFEELADSVGTLMFAGHETTAVSIAWSFYHLHRHPVWLHRLCEELDASDGRAETYATMPLLNAIVQEVLRLNPIVPEVLRVVREPFRLGDYDIPVGHGVAAAGCLTHYDSSVYEAPDVFNPERFLDRTYKPSEYYPFGGGTRRCVGAGFAIYELMIALGTILRSHELELLDQKEVLPIRRNVTMGPSTGVRLRVLRRR